MNIPIHGLVLKLVNTIHCIFLCYGVSDIGLVATGGSDSALPYSPQSRGKQYRVYKYRYECKAKGSPVRIS